MKEEEASSNQKLKIKQMELQDLISKPIPITYAQPNKKDAQSRSSSNTRQAKHTQTDNKEVQTLDSAIKTDSREVQTEKTRPDAASANQEAKPGEQA